MFNKVELFGAGVCVGLMTLALYLTQINSVLNGVELEQQSAMSQSGAVVVGSGGNERASQVQALRQASNNQGNLERMVIDDITIGRGEEVKDGDVVLVHYVGRLQDGTEFDNSRKRGAPFEFQVGGGQVISGWEEGLVGMKVGGERILVIPPEKGYGDQGIGPIPGGATLVFSIELLEIK